MASKLDTYCICGHQVCDHDGPAEYSEYDPQIYRGLPSRLRLGGCLERGCNCEDWCADDVPMQLAACQSCGGTGSTEHDDFVACTACDAAAVLA